MTVFLELLVTCWALVSGIGFGSCSGSGSFNGGIGRAVLCLGGVLALRAWGRRGGVAGGVAGGVLVVAVGCACRISF